MRLIDADALFLPDERSDKVLILGGRSGKTVTMAMKLLTQKVNNAPTIEAEPVKHGRWVNAHDNPVAFEKRDSRCPSESCYCSECGEWLTASDEYSCVGRYCPNCGAKMDGDYGEEKEE